VGQLLHPLNKSVCALYNNLSICSRTYLHKDQLSVYESALYLLTGLNDD